MCPTVNLSLFKAKSFYDGICHDTFQSIEKGLLEAVPISVVSKLVEKVIQMIKKSEVTVFYKNKKDLGMKWMEDCKEVNLDDGEIAWLEHHCPTCYEIDKEAGVNIPKQCKKCTSKENLPAELEFLPLMQEPLLEMLNFKDEVKGGSVSNGPCFLLPFLTWTCMEGMNSLSFMCDPMQESQAKLSHVSAIDLLPEKPKYLVFGSQQCKVIQVVACNE